MTSQYFQALTVAEDTEFVEVLLQLVSRSRTNFLNPTESGAVRFLDKKLDRCRRRNNTTNNF